MRWAEPCMGTAGAKVTALGCGALSVLATTAACTGSTGTTGAGSLPSASLSDSFFTAKPEHQSVGQSLGIPAPVPVQPTPS